MRIYWIGQGKPGNVPSGLRLIGGTGSNVYETHDSHAARELGGTDARWSMSKPVAQKMPPKNDPNRMLRAEMESRKAKEAKERIAAARARGEELPAEKTPDAETLAVLDERERKALAEEGDEIDASGRSRSASGKFQKAGAVDPEDEDDEDDDGE